MKPLEWTVGLTDEQQYAVMMQGPRQLVVASAGSGKTATLVARAIHAVRSGRLQARQVLVLAFNRAAAHELDARLQARLRETGKRDGPPIRASTLHAFALSFVQRAHGTRYRVVDDILPLALQQLPEHCAVFSDYWLFFRVFDGMEIRHPDDFPSWRAWRRFVGEQAACLDGQRGFLTLRHELVDTHFEQAVANWLYLHDVDYCYAWHGRWPAGLAAVFPGCGRPLSGSRVFILKGCGRHLVCLDRTRQSTGRPSRAGRQDIVVTLDDFRSGRLFRVLRQRLRSGRQPIPSGRLAGLMDRAGLGLNGRILSSLQRSVALARLNRLDDAQLQRRLPAGSGTLQTRYAIPLLMRLTEWCRQFGLEQGVIDHHGMLEQAVIAMQAGKARHGYGLILVDEFQDTSRLGVALLQAMLGQDPSCQLFAVGDDWQSIYRFAGAQSDVLQQFGTLFGSVQLAYLTRTFRFDQYLADVAGKFIRKNPAQWVKTVRAHRPGSPDTIQLCSYTSADHMQRQCEQILQALATHKDRPASVLILGRYRHLVPAGLPRWRQSFPLLHIVYQT
ncbi:MAG TPA: UvrD-helicase domain-containing protein, partial [Burkholderiaceae bacterium]|nr:UvrD-helicase domain-containing protein [Burkholderiaceae bacterium]